MSRPPPRATPRATPAARAPKSSVMVLGQEPRRPVLQAPIFIVTPEGEIELSTGWLSVGRLFPADLLLEDPLVSRVHARIGVEENGNICVEDLASTNGVFVNGVRITTGKSELSEGDRLLIGTTELSVFSAQRRERPTQPAPPARSSPPRRTESPRRSSVPATARAEAIEIVGQVALRHAESGAVDEAVRVLSSHLNRLLLNATGGLAVAGPHLDRASELALKLYDWTANSAWLDYVIDLHLAVQALPSERVVGLLEGTLRDPEVKFDRLLLVYLVEKLGRKRSSFSSAELGRLSRLDRITRFS